MDLISEIKKLLIDNKNNEVLDLLKSNNIDLDTAKEIFNIVPSDIKSYVFDEYIFKNVEDSEKYTYILDLDRSDVLKYKDFLIKFIKENESFLNINTIPDEILLECIKNEPEGVLKERIISNLSNRHCFYSEFVVGSNHLSSLNLSDVSNNILFACMDVVSDSKKEEIVSELRKRHRIELSEKYPNVYRKLYKTIYNSKDIEMEPLDSFDGISSEELYPFLEIISDTSNKKKIINALDDKHKLKYIVEYCKYPYNSEELYDIISKIKDENILKILIVDMKVLNSEYSRKFRMLHGQFAKKYYLDFVELESGNVEDLDDRKKNLSSIIDEVSDEQFGCMNMGVLSSKIVGNSHLDEVLFYIKQKDTDRLMLLDEKEIQVFLMCLDYYKNTTNASEIFTISNFLLKNMLTHQYSDLINSIEDINNLDLKKRDLLYKIMQNNNIFDLTNIDQLDDYDNIVEAKYNKLMNGNLEDKRMAVLFKLFGITTGYAKSLVSDYSNFLKFENSFLKDYLSVVQEILKTNDEDVLEEIFNKYKKVTFVDRTFYDNEIRKEYGKMYNKNTFKPTKDKLISEEKNMYDAGLDFSMIISVVGMQGFRDIGNYYSDWNGKSGATKNSTSSIFCASYIRPNCLGSYGAKSRVTYGFNSLDPSTMVGCYSSDAGTSSGNSEYTVLKAFDDPDTLVDNTGLSIVYNEINYVRFSNSKRQQPDYLVGYRINGVIENENELLKAQKSFNGIPIVVVDVNKCIDKTKREVLEMINEYNKTKSKKLRKKIVNEIQRNRLVCVQLGLDVFLPDINIDMLEETNDNEIKNDKEKKLEEMLNDMNKYIEEESNTKVA